MIKNTVHGPNKSAPRFISENDNDTRSRQFRSKLLSFAPF